jgi:NDP-sugar pyrophosphorylase family protein
MLEIAGRPLIEWQMQWLKKNKIKDLVICVGYLKEKIMEHVGNGSRFGVNVSYSVEEKALGTGGAIKNAQQVLSSDLEQEGGFYVINGDILTNIDPGMLAGEINGISAVPMRNPYGVISTVDNKDVSYVSEFLQKPVMENIWINAGVYYLRKEIFGYLPEVGDFEASVLPMLARQGRLRAAKYGKPYYWRSIDSHWDLEEASKEASNLDIL